MHIVWLFATYRTNSQLRPGLLPKSAAGGGLAPTILCSSVVSLVSYGLIGLFRRHQVIYATNIYITNEEMFIKTLEETSIETLEERNVYRNAGGNTSRNAGDRNFGGTNVYQNATLGQTSIERLEETSRSMLG